MVESDGKTIQNLQKVLQYKYRAVNNTQVDSSDYDSKLNNATLNAPVVRMQDTAPIWWLT